VKAFLLAQLALAQTSWPPAIPPLPLVCPQSAENPLFAIKELRPAAWPDLWDDLKSERAAEAAAATASYWAGQAPDKAVKVGKRTLKAAELAQAYAALAEAIRQESDPAALRSRLQKNFEVLEAVTDAGGTEGTITAYYDPELPVSAKPLPEHVPVHALPAVTDHSRAEITAGALDGQNLELFWTRHAADLNVAQTQGSAWAVLPDGSRARLSYAGNNGRPFRSVGQALIDCGLIPAGTPPLEILRTIKAQTFERERSWVDLNSRYIFFKKQSGGGPWGALGVSLLAGRSIAVDPAHVPLGLAGFLVSRKPVAGGEGGVSFEPLSRFIFTHDVGSAIRGPVRVDLFWGSGKAASIEAHHMKQPGRLYILLPLP
jgi:membrane-bound lytic murein transglycosylase A